MDFAQQQRNPAKHAVGIAVVIVFHLLVVYALVTGLARKVVEVVRQPLQTKIIEEVKEPPKDTPPPPPPKLAPPPPPFIPPPEVNVNVAPPPAAATITTVTTTVPTAPPPPAAPPPKLDVVRVAPSVGRCPDSDSVYPPAARRLEQEGTVMLRVLVDAEGRITQSEVEKSSGFNNLDEAARAAVVQCRGGRAGTADGKAEPLWTRLKYTFKLQ